MKELLKNINYNLLSGNLESSVDYIVIDSKLAYEDSLFVCLKGAKYDSHNYILDAYKQGCRNFIVEREKEFKWNFTSVFK